MRFLKAWLLMAAIPAMASASFAAANSDETFAISHINNNLRNQCLQDFTRKLGQSYMPASAKVQQVDMAGKLSYSEQLTHEVGDLMYWRDADRGVAFLLPVNVRADKLGNFTTSVACFYAVQADGLAFQTSQQFLWHL